jgi:hypothetical protein
MTNNEQSEIKERLDLIESMLAAGRRTTESWGWTFVLWGVAYYIAIAWATWGHTYIAWPITMLAAGVATAVAASRKSSRGPETTIGRAMASIWMALGIAMFLLFMSLGFSRRLEEQVFVAVACAMLGMANATSGMILRWHMQLACAVVWWLAAIGACFASAGQSTMVFLAAIFFCQIVFGIYAMVCESRRRQRGALHA